MEKTSCTLEDHLTEKQLMVLRRTIAKAASSWSRFRGASHDMKMGCRKYLANVSDTAAFLARG